MDIKGRKLGCILACALADAAGTCLYHFDDHVRLTPYAIAIWSRDKLKRYLYDRKLVSCAFIYISNMKNARGCDKNSC